MFLKFTIEELGIFFPLETNKISRKKILIKKKKKKTVQDLQDFGPGTEGNTTFFFWPYLFCPIWAGRHTCMCAASFRYYSKSGGELKQNITMKRHAYSCSPNFIPIWNVCIQVTTVVIYAKSCLGMSFLPKSGQITGTGFNWVRAHSQNFVLVLGIRISFNIYSVRSSHYSIACFWRQSVSDQIRHVHYSCHSLTCVTEVSGLPMLVPCALVVHLGAQTVWSVGSSEATSIHVHARVRFAFLMTASSMLQKTHISCVQKLILIKG